MTWTPLLDFLPPQEYTQGGIVYFFPLSEIVLAYLEDR